MQRRQQRSHGRLAGIDGLVGAIELQHPDVAEPRLDQNVRRVTGKTRGASRGPAGADKATIEAQACASEEVMRFSEGRPVKKVIVVPGRLVNVVA